MTAAPPHSQPDTDEGERLSNWLADYSQDLMEDGDLDQEAAEVLKASQWIEVATSEIAGLREANHHYRDAAAQQQSGVLSRDDDDIHTLVEQLRAENDILRDKLHRAQSPVGWGDTVHDERLPSASSISSTNLGGDK